MFEVKIISGVVLAALWTAVGWIIIRHRRIERELVRNEAMPRPVPRLNFLLLLTVVVVGLSGLLLYLIFG